MRSLSRLVAILAMSVSVSSCALPYYWQAVGGQLELMRKREPIESVLTDPDTDPGLKAQLKTVVELRRFAVAELGLPDNKSYTSYVDLGRPYVVWNVIATPEFSIEPKRWCFPVAGCVSYRGYFDRDDAERFQLELSERGLDTYSGGSGAYSTLGYFSDPVLSTMLAGGAERIGAILFHELAHQRVYIKGDTELSEAFATTVEEYGVEHWLQAHADGAALAAYRDRLARRAAFSDLIARQRERLQVVYAQALAPDELREAKAEAFGRLEAEYLALKSGWGGSSEFDGWFGPGMNNATLVAVSTYRRWVPGLRWRLDSAGIERFYADVEALAELEPEARTAQLEAWNLGSASGRVAQLR